MSIEKNTTVSLGEMIALYLIPSNYIETVPDPDDDFELDFDDFELKSGKNFEKIYFSPHSGNFTENQNQDKNNVIYNKKINFKVPQNRSEVTAWFRSRRHYFFSAIIQSADGTWYFVERNLSIGMQRVMPESSDKYNGYEISLSGVHSDSAPAVNNVSLS